MGLASRIAARATLEVEAPAGSGLWWRLRPLVAGDLLSAHVALLAAVIPPSEADRLTLAAAEEAPEAERQEILASYGRELRQRAADPDLQAQAWAHACACVCAAVTHAREGADGAWEVITVTVKESERDLGANRLHTSDLPPGAIRTLAGIIRTASFGGEAAQSRLARFRRQPTPPAARSDGPDVG